MKSRITRFSLAALAAAILALAFASASFAQGSSVETYAGSGGKVQSQIASSGDPIASSGDPSAISDPGSLPFTGLDLGLAFGGGLVLLAAGALIRQAQPSR